MCNKSTSAGTSLEGTSMFAHVTLHRTFNPLGSRPRARSKMPLVARWGSSFLRTIAFLIIHRFLSLKVLLLIYLLFKSAAYNTFQYWKIVFDLVKGTWHHNFMAGCGSLLWANTCIACYIWRGIKSWPGAGCLQLSGWSDALDGQYCHTTSGLPYVYHRRGMNVRMALGGE